MQRFDSIISGGDVIDGTGAARRRTDVGIVDDRIVAVGDLAAAEAGHRIDAAGRCVAPGFIDAHTHDDNIVFVTPDMAMKVSQGVTSVVAGNCGVSLAPLALAAAPPPPLDLIGDRRDFRFAHMADYFAALDADPPATNIVAMVGHSTLRAGEMDRFDRAATGDEIRRMAARLDEGLAAGAIGMSTGLFYPPARHAPTEEVIALAHVAARHGTLYATHMRDEGDHVLDSIEESARIGREAGLPVILSHHKVAGVANHGRTVETLAAIDRVRRTQPLGFDVYPYVAASTVLSRDRVQTSSRTLVSWSKTVPAASGRDLAEIAAEWGVSPEAAVDRLLPAGAIYFLMNEEDVQRILRHPEAMIGSDGLPHDVHPHPRLWGSFPRVLGHYSRELALFPLEEAIRRMTGLTAARFGLRDRGVVRTGAFADLVILDPAAIIDRASFEAPKKPAAGVETVIVNGRTVWRAGALTGARPGRALRRQALDAPMKDWRASA
ncbi:MAG: D-aminoacylase [Alphaproteobacteria bacterium]|nr:D-aminoacylase [Alphaproteobacteria bacterium]